MSDQNKRVLLNDDVVEKISGGELLYYCVRGEQHYMWSDENPDYKYAFEKADMKEINKYIFFNCDGLSDQETLAQLQNLGLIHLM